MIRNALIALSMALVVGTAAAEEKLASAEEKLAHQHQGDGYTVRFPAGWHVADRNTVRMRSSTTDVMIVKGLGFDGSPNVGVSFENQEIPTDEANREEYRSEFARGVTSVLKAAGGRVEHLAVRDEILNGCPAYSIQFDMVLMGRTTTHKQYAIPKGGRTYFVTCTGQKGNFRLHEPAFHAIASSIEVSPFGSMPRWLVLTLVGVSVAMLVVLVGKLLTRSPAPATEPSYRI